jgi:parallel beta-helix repeat protein
MATYLGCSFTGNEAAVYGGAIYNYPDSGTLIHGCTFNRNFAYEFGGAIWNLEAAPRIEGCVFSGNSSENGGAIWDHAESRSTIVNCTLSGNRATQSGGGIFTDSDSQTTIINSVLWNNQDAAGTVESSQVTLNNAQVFLNHSCIQGLTGTLGGTGNVAFDPEFVDENGADGVAGTGDEDLRLRDVSPCIDAGNNAAVTVGADVEQIPRRIDALSRADSGQGIAPLVDMGAYEFHTDCNGNGIANDQDIAAGNSPDGNGNGIPDECELRTLQIKPNGARYIIVSAEVMFSTVPVAIHLTSPDYPCLEKYVDSAGLLRSTPVFQAASDWTVLDVRGPDVVPQTRYMVDMQFINGSRGPGTDAVTARWGDTAGNFVGNAWAPPDSIVSITDAVACLDRFRSRPSAPPLTQCDLMPQIPDGLIDISDIVAILDAFRARPYPFAAPCP